VKEERKERRKGAFFPLLGETAERWREERTFFAANADLHLFVFCFQMLFLSGCGQRKGRKGANNATNESRAFFFLENSSSGKKNSTIHRRGRIKAESTLEETGYI
jgi:hypothetical protein